MSYATVTPANLELSPMRVKFKGVDLGATLGNVAISFETTKAEIKADQFGDSVVDRRVSGQKATVSFEIAEVLFKDNWKVVFPHFNLVTSGPNKAIFSDSRIGQGDQAAAGALLLHPLSKTDADLSGDYTFYKAISDGTSEIVYGPGEQARLKVTFTILLDFTTLPPRMFLHGDPAIGLVAPSQTNSFVGTGNGAIGTFTLFPGVTKTEAITATCIHAATDAGKFEVVGALSGALGVATVGIGFVSGPVAFTIADGATDFIVGDAFTINTVAGNYV